MEKYHKEFRNVELERSSHTQEKPYETHLRFMQKWTWWTQKSISGQGVTRSGRLKDRSVRIKWVQAYPIDRYEDLATDPKEAPPPIETSARYQGKWSRNFIKFNI